MSTQNGLRSAGARGKAAILVACFMATTVSACFEKSTGASAPGEPPTRPSSATDAGNIPAATHGADKIAPPTEIADQAAAPIAPTAAAPITLDPLCADICDRSRLLKCAHPDTCKPNCMAMASLTPCSDEFVSFYKCLVGQPLRNWECAEDGVAAIRDGFCESEQTRAAACMSAKMKN